MYIDKWYIILVVPAILLSLLAQLNVKRTYSAMARIANSRRITGARAAQMVLDHYGIHDVAIQSIGGQLSDHYDPRSKVIRLSSEVYSGTSIASVGIACHEAGHAAQHAQSYKPIKVRNAVLPVANIGSSMGLFIAVLGIAFSFEPLLIAGIALFSAVVLFQLVTLPIEFNASSRAMKVIASTGMLDEDEKPKARKVLTAAAMTYVAALLVSVMNLLRILLRANNRRRR